MMIKTFCMTAVAALALGGAVSAQTMIGDQNVSVGELPSVTAHCEMLSAGTGTTEGEPGNTGSPETTGREANTDATDLGTTAGEAGVPGNSGNADAAKDSVNAAAGTVASTENTAPPANSGNMDAEEAVGRIDLQKITVADCQAAGL